MMGDCITPKWDLLSRFRLANRHSLLKGLLPLLAILILTACQQEKTSDRPSAKSLFSSVEPASAGIDFINQLDYTEDFNVYTYRNFYNGAGLGLGDFNNDGLVDIYFAGNQADNKLYLNQGEFEFVDITEHAGVACSQVWSTGISLADVNGDGWLDIYVCKSGDTTGSNRHNELFINQGNPDDAGRITFVEAAKEYGIADRGLAVHAAFFDYDRDGDLDCYLLNNSMRSVGGYDLRPGQREIRDPNGGNKLYRNDGETFTDVSEAAGIYGSNIGFGLGVTIGDVNLDGWSDIFVSNDFFERDYLYLNQQNGTFSEVLESSMAEISMGSMGADMADINNDGWPEIFVTEMLPQTEQRLKTKTVFENWDKYQLNVSSGYHHQFTRNALHLNNGLVGDAGISFSEVSRLAGVHATDWSWGALIFDMDNDGRKDIFVANGIFKDLTDQDYIQFFSDANQVRQIINTEDQAILKLVDIIPSERIPNCAFANQGHLQFEDLAQDWGLGQASHSNGSAYADLDNDGDLDLVVNNVNMPPFLYRNNTETLKTHHYLTLELKGSKKNTQAIGAKVSLYSDGELFYQEISPMRGFQSSIDSKLHFGLGEKNKIDSLLIIWPDGSKSQRKNIAVDQILTIEQKPDQLAKGAKLPSAAGASIFQTALHPPTLNYTHRENEFVDFDQDRLIYQMNSIAGPAVATGDLYGTGKTAVFLGGAKGSPGALFVQQAGQTFKQIANADFEKDKASEDVDARFFDADGDGDLDLYVASGGSEYSNSSFALVDRLYLNEGNYQFSRSPQALPIRAFTSTSCVRPADYDGDGDFDLLVGTRLDPQLYGVPVSSFLWENDGRGNFKDVTAQKAPGLQKIGMLTDACWTDYDLDGSLDLILVGDWMPVMVFKNKGGQLEWQKDLPGLAKSNGWWNAIASADLDGDGDPDFVLGNHGLNSRLKISAEEPAQAYINDFDQNGRAEQIFCVYNEGKSYPLALRHDLVMQLPYLKKKYLKYENYQRQQVTDIFSPEQLEHSIVLQAYEAETMVLINDGAAGFRRKQLPMEAQLAPVYAIELTDFDADGKTDILLGGNLSRSKPELGIYQASRGLLLKNQGENDFAALSAQESGIYIRGDIRGFATLQMDQKNWLLVARNNDAIKFFQY